ncbi:MAG: DNA-binding protein [Polaromonas sp.]
MQSKILRGIQQSDVWAAADTLIAEGLRPTIERVRQKIGRGSPNTVSPMLEAWFATLGARLGVNTPQDEAHHIPKALHESMEKLWMMALSTGQELADQKMEQAQFDLREEREALKLRESELIQQEQVLAVKHEALEVALRIAMGKAEDLISRLDQQQALTSRREVEIETLRARLAVTENERDADRHRIDEDAARNTKERQKYEERAEATQRKFLEEIDRARQETKKIRKDAEISENHFEAERRLLQQKIQSYEVELSKAQEFSSMQTVDLNSLREALVASNIRSEEFRHLLEKHQISSQNTIARLTEALSTHTDRQQAGGKLVRKIKRPMRIREL